MAPNNRVTQPAAAAERIKKSVKAYCDVKGASLRADDCEVLGSLAADIVAVKAFGAFDLDDRGAVRLLDACIEAREITRNFKLWAEHERLVPKRMDKLEQAVADLRGFVEELVRGPAHKLAAWIEHDPDDWGAMRHGLGLISDDIAVRRRIAHETLVRLGAGRKLADVAESKAIGWLAKAIQRIAGKPHTKYVADLATVVLELEESCSSVRVVKARKLLDREWRMPLSKVRDTRGKRD